MKRKFPSIFLLFPISLILLFFVSCGPAVLMENATATPTTPNEILATPSPDITASPTCLWEDWLCPSDSLTLTAEMAPTLAALQTGTPACTWPCPDDSLTLTAVMGATLAAVPSSTPPPWATILPAVGDLGWGSVYGKIMDGVTYLPIEGATVECEHFSYTPSPYPCIGITTTNSDGIYAFTSVFFHDTDRITLIVEAPGYTPLRFEQAFFTRAEFPADLGLFPVSADLTLTPTPFIMCTPPACSGGVLVCGSLDGCVGGCGTICIMESPTPF